MAKNTAWLGAPPVSEAGFAFHNGDFFAQASNGNQHRRATTLEFKTHFTSGSDKDHPAHWFEAQLLHYGLPSSKVKSTARMRLWDAMNAGKLEVPAANRKLEGKLKKEWNKQDREMKKASKAANAEGQSKKTAAAKKEKGKAPATATAAKQTTTPAAKSANTTKATKRKAESEATSSRSSKKTVTSTSAAGPSSSAPQPPKAMSTGRDGTSKGSGRSKVIAASPTVASSAEKPTARPRRGGISQGQGRGASQPTSELDRPPRAKQTARRSRPFMPVGSRQAASGPSNYNDALDEPPPPYSLEDSSNIYASPDGYRDGYSSVDGYDSPSNDIPGDFNDPYPDSDSGVRGPLGLLNGDYAISCPRADQEWAYLSTGGLNMTLTLSGSSLWGRFDLGVYEGVLRLEERPRNASTQRIPFTWRGREAEGEITYGNSNGGWLQFLGGGYVEGELDMQRIRFRGERIEGQGTRSPVTVAEMRRLWEEDYSEREYERLNRARWGGSGSWW